MTSGRTLSKPTRVDRFYSELYRRATGRYLDVLIATVAVAVVVLVVPIYSTMLFPFFDLTGWEFVEVVLTFEPFMAIAGIGAVVITRRQHVALRRWMGGDHGPGEAPLAWDSAVIAFPRTVILVSAWYAAWVVPAAALVSDTADMSVLAGVFYFLWLALLIMGLGVFGFLLTEQALRPVVQEIASHLPTRFVHRPSRISLGTKLLVLVPVINLYTGAIVAAVSANSLGREGRLAVAFGSALLVSATISLLLSMMFRKSLLSRLEDVRGVVSRVDQGDLDARVQRLAADELDEVGQSVNEMVAGLRERESLRSEKEELLEEVRASRARLVAAADAERRRVERNLHDGAQQRLVALALQLAMLEDGAEDDAQRAKASAARADLGKALAELRDLARGLHPQVLSTGGLKPALEQLAERSPVPVSVEASPERYPDPIESTAYFVASEALANIAKYAEASRAEITAERQNGRLMVTISDDGVGGADPASGSGLSGLVDRVAALDGELSVESPTGAGTRLTVELPLGNAESGDFSVSTEPADRPRGI